MSIVSLVKLDEIFENASGGGDGATVDGNEVAIISNFDGICSAVSGHFAICCSPYRLPPWQRQHQ